MKRYAEKTTVSISKSREEIDRLLRNWGCDGIAWSDNFRAGMAELRFVWPRDGVDYVARFSISMPNDAELRASDEVLDGRTGQISEKKLEKLRDSVGKQEHRVLALWLKASLNAVHAGIVQAEVLFLPFLEGKDGRTVAEVAVPQMAELLKGSAKRLLPSRIK